VGLRPRVKRGRDADRLLTAIVSTGNGASSAIYLLGVLDTARAMRDTQNTEARRLITRTYEGVQWFKHGHSRDSTAFWFASVPGTKLAVVRRPIHAKYGTPMHEVRVASWNSHVEAWELFPSLPGAAHFEHIAHGYRIPWSRVVTQTVSAACRHVHVLRNNVAKVDA
jgi:hypothetical protein